MRRTLTEAETARCVQFLRTLGIRDPNHEVLSNRGFFALFLSGLQQDGVRQRNLSERHRAYLDTIRLLSILGVEKVREVLAEIQKKQETRSEITDLTTQQKRQIAEIEKRNRRPFTRDIKIVRPTPEEYEHLRSLDHAESRDQAIEMARTAMEKGQLHDAYHIMVDYLLHHPLSIESFRCATDIVLRASAFSRERKIPPENMLFECEEMAAVLYRRIPDMSALQDGGKDDVSNKLYQFVRLVYQTWTTHCYSLLEYKYRIDKNTWTRRNWIDPRDFGFLVEVMRMGVSSRLPLDLLRMIYTELRKCVDLGKYVIAHEDKKHRFEGDLLRIIASPTKDVVPDLCFLIYTHIVEAYLKQGDSQSAVIFCRQALLIQKNHRGMNQILQDILAGKYNRRPAG